MEVWPLCQDSYSELNHGLKISLSTLFTWQLLTRPDITYVIFVFINEGILHFNEFSFKNSRLGNQNLITPGTHSGICKVLFHMILQNSPIMRTFLLKEFKYWPMIGILWIQTKGKISSKGCRSSYTTSLLIWVNLMGKMS